LNLERVVATVSGGGVPEADVVACVRVFTRGSGLAGWEGYFEAVAPFSFPPGAYEFAAADGRLSRIRVTHVGVNRSNPTRVEFTGFGPFL
jgi:hypothetical protein